MAAPAGRREIAVTTKKGRFLACEPLFERGPQVAVSGGKRIGPDRLALVEHSGRGARIVRELGRPDRARDVIGALLVERGPGPFPDAVEAEAKRAAKTVGQEGRRDLTELATFTVDPATARDFDDAVSASRTRDGIRLWIHIADVAAHVLPGSVLEAEALRRANSTYVPGEVAPMLPHSLSSDACSLSPGVERPTVTAEIKLSESGEPRSADFYRSTIRSDARLDYDGLDRIFSGAETPPRAVVEPLELARLAAASLSHGRSSLEVTSNEPEFVFDGPHVVGATTVPETEAHRLIERLMVLTNEQVAQLLERRRVPALYRVHEQPDAVRIKAMIDQLASLDVPTPAVSKEVAPSEAGAIAIEASRLAAREAERRGHGGQAYTSLVLRSLKPAIYSERNVGHAGLGSHAYSHFTSPIRRFPDLIVHRGLLSAVGGDEIAPPASEMGEIAVHCSEREREATRVERDADSICSSFLLARESREQGPGARYAGEVVGVIGAGAFVRFGGELSDGYEGFVPARTIGGRERYELNEQETMLIGRGGGSAVRLGDPLEVTVERIDAPRGRVDLLLAEPKGKAKKR